ncbi:MAG TPA: NAD(P) transhydrogenase subunit alpha [Gemmatimonadales bacterium]|nr:NAD(P) transhydrogenase subunit alpha [Gemmatimonadales bacterium]
MRISILREAAPLERRVALVPDMVRRLVKAGHEVIVEAGAGLEAGFADASYAEAGAQVSGDHGAVIQRAEALLAVQRPAPDDLTQLGRGTLLIGLLRPTADDVFVPALAAAGVTVLAMELVPRTTKAQTMDALSSQATVAGYKAVLIGAAELPKLLPMLTTAAGTLAPARAFILGAGVAGLQAIATARRLGAVVSAFDVRPVVKEQVESLGASFVAAEAVAAGAETSGGYARELAEEQQQRVLDAVGRHIREIDLVVTTAQIPGKAAPRLITEAMVASMRAGAVIVDLAAESGGNCELTRPGEVIRAGGVTIIGPLNLAATVPLHASQMYARNLVAVVEHLTGTGNLLIDLSDPITGAMCVAHGGTVHSGGTA